MEDFVFKTMTSSFALLVLYIVIRFVNNIWWRPRSTEKLLRQQGIRGSSYKLFNGDISDMKNSALKASSKAISLNHQIVPRVIPFIHKMVQQHGNVSLCWFGRRPRLIVVDAELTRLVLTNKNGHFTKPPRNPLVKILTQGLSSLEGEAWTKRRRLVTSAFQLQKLKAMVPAFSSSCHNMIQRWEKLVEPNGSFELDVSSEFDVLAGDVIARTAFGSSYQEGKKIFELQKEQAILVSEALNNIYIPGFRFLPTKKNKRRYNLDVQIKAMLRDIIQKKEQVMREEGKLKENDLLSILLQCRDQNNSLTTEDVIEECKLFYFAGQVTTANTLAWTMIVLSMHPDWQEKARAEVLGIFGKKAPDFEGINHLKIVSMILYEVLRLYPPITVINKYNWCETRVGNMSIPAGVEVCLPLLLLHYDGNYWEKPEEFNPVRFTEGVSKASKDHIAFYPFGWGPRICPGQNFAFLEAKMALATILQHFSFQLSPSYAHAPSNSITLKPQFGAPIVIRRI
ncbi:cytochrome P450 CYP72A219 isoform X1 [Cajanus cajan]|uniref:Secologanin synthase n=1 Tax=Cajanus cajan TaxID=3821 RepID=A0A151RST3_CAJCA|nr:cytochrome P450 CYP72A219 isoform X1 [Cajanus cajan]KYP45595.1 Secologanin synthase [Cajanus cajan]